MHLGYRGMQDESLDKSDVRKSNKIREKNGKKIK
jgi:hypothetical protein